MTDPSRSRSMSRSRSPSSRRRRGSGSRRDHSQGPGLGETAPDPGGTLRVQVRRRPLLLLPSYGSNTNNQLELGSMIAVSSIFMEDTGISSAGGGSGGAGRGPGLVQTTPGQFLYCTQRIIQIQRIQLCAASSPSQSPAQSRGAIGLGREGPPVGEQGGQLGTRECPRDQEDPRNHRQLCLQVLLISFKLSVPRSYGTGEVPLQESRVDNWVHVSVPGGMEIQVKIDPENYSSALTCY